MWVQAQSGEIVLTEIDDQPEHLQQQQHPQQQPEIQLQERQEDQSESNHQQQEVSHQLTMSAPKPQLEEKTTSRRKKLTRSNSTSSLYVSSTIINPDIDEIVLSVSTMLHCQMVRDEDASEARKKKFPYFQEEKYTRKRVTKIPDAEQIYSFLREVFQVGEFHPECCVILLVYINRLIGLVDMPLTCSNWKPVTIIALILAQKVWDDNPLANADFSILYSALNIKQINALEVKFLRLLQYKLTVTASLYARYYFELRTICDNESRMFTVKPLSKKASERLDIRDKKKKKKLVRAQALEDAQPLAHPRLVLS